MTASQAKVAFRRVLEAIILTLMTALALVVVVGVVFRKAGASLVWYDEIASILLAWLTYYGAALAALHRAHIGMPTLVARLTGGVRAAVILLAEACTLTFFVVLAWAGVRVLSVLGGTTLTSLPWMPMSVAQSVIPIGAVLFIIAQLVSLPDVLRGTTEGPDDDDEGPGGGSDRSDDAVGPGAGAPAQEAIP